MSLVYSGVEPQPALAWQFEGTTTDYVTGLTGTTTGSVTYVPGKYNQAISIPGTQGVTPPTSNVLYTLSNPISVNKGCTLSLWVNVSTYLSSSGQGAFVYGLTSYPNGIRLNYNWAGGGNPHNFLCQFYYTGVAHTQIAFNGVTTNTWYHCVCVIDSTGKNLFYINGSLVGTDSVAVGNVNNPTNITGIIVGSGAGFSQFNGLVDDLRIYNTALTAAQVQSVYSSQGAPAPSLAMPLPQYAWSFDGTTTDYVKGLTGTTTGSVTYGPGKYNQGMSVFNVVGTDSASNLVSYSVVLNSTNGFTVSVWTRVDVVKTGSYASMIGLSATTNTGGFFNYFDIYENPGGTFGFYGQNQSGSGIVPVPFNTSTTPVLGGWYHVTTVFTNSTISMYVNGIASGSGTYANAFTTNTMYLGRSGQYSGHSYCGSYDDLRIFNTALTSTQVQSIYNQQGMPGRGALSPSYGGPLTDASNLNRIYGLQRLTTAYTGNIINLRRSTDNTNVDFTVDSTNTSLVTASGGQTLSSWLGAGTANVVIWYDQSGNGRNLTQLTNGNQPGFSATTGLLYATNLYMNFSDDMSITDASFSVGYIQRGYYGPGSSSQWYQQDMIVAGERAGVTNDYGLVIGGSGLFGLGTGPTDGAASTIATNGTGVYSFMTCTRNSTTGQVLLYNGAGSGTSFTKNTGTLAGPNPTLMGKLTYSSGFGFLNADVSSFFMFNSVKSPSEIASIASRFVNSTFKPNTGAMSGTPLFSQLSPAATSSAVGAFSLRAVNGTSIGGTAKAVRVQAQGQFPPNFSPYFASTAVQVGNQFTQSFPNAYSGVLSVMNGNYTCNCSSFVPDAVTNREACFNAFDSNTQTYWENNYFVQAGYGGVGAGGSNSYNGSYTTIVSGSSIGGEWLQVGLPTAIILNSYSMYGRSGFSYRMPYQFVVAGSNDGITWTTVDSQNGINTWSGQTPITFTTTSSTPWFYFRLITQAIQGNGTASDLNIAQWTLYSSNVSWQNDFYADRLGNLLTAPVVGQSLANWLGGATGYVTTWYDQSGAGNHFIQTDTAKQPQIVINSGKWTVFFNRDTTPTFYSNLSCVNNITGVQSIVYNFNMSSTFNTYQTLLGQNLNDNGGFRFNNRLITGGNNNRDFLAGTGSYWYLNNNYGSQPTPTNNLYTDNIWNYAIGVCPSTSSAPWTAFAFNSISSPAATLTARATYGYLSEMLIFTSQIGASDAGVMYNTRYQ